MSKLKAAVLWSFLLTAGGKAIASALTFVLAAILAPEDFGALALGMTWVSLVLMLHQHGPTLALMQLEKVTDEQVDAAFWTTISGTVVFCAIFAALVPAWAKLNHLPLLGPVSWALIAVALLNSINVIPEAMLRRELKYRSIALRGLASASLGGIVGVAAALMHWGVWALVLQQIVQFLVYAVTVWGVVAWRPSFPRPGRVAREMKVMRQQSLHTLGGAVGTFLSLRMDVLMMGAFFGPVMVGLNRFALRLSELAVDLTSRGLQSVSLPELARHQADRELLGRRLADLVHVSVVLAFPALGVLAAVAHPLVSAIGPQWNDAAIALQLLCLLSGLAAVSSLLGPAMQAVSRGGVPALLTWVGAGLSAVALLGAYYICRDWTVVGQLVAVSVASLVVQIILLVASAVLAYGYVLKVSIVPTLKRVTPALIATAVGYGTAWLTLRLFGHVPHNGVTLGRVDYVLDFVIAGAVGAICSIGLLVVIDDVVREQVLKVLARVRRRRPEPALAAVE